MDLFDKSSQKLLCTNSGVNGRLDIRQPLKADIFQLYDKINLNNKSTNYQEALTGNWDSNILSSAFFSAQNVRILQNGIRAGVYQKSQQRFSIGDQNEDTLKIIMRSTFLSHAVNLPNNITEQISELNKLVVDYCVPQLLGECEGYIKFKDDVSSLVVPIDRPMSTYHSNTLETKRFF